MSVPVCRRTEYLFNEKDITNADIIKQKILSRLLRSSLSITLSLIPFYIVKSPNIKTFVTFVTLPLASFYPLPFPQVLALLLL